MFGVVFWFWLGNSMTHTKIVEFLIIYLTPQVRDNLYVVVVIFKNNFSKIFKLSRQCLAALCYEYPPWSVVAIFILHPSEWGAWALGSVQLQVILPLIKSLKDLTTSYIHCKKGNYFSCSQPGCH